MSFLKNIKTPEQLAAEASEQLTDQARSQRNALLAETDYIVMLDYPITTELLASVQEYRQLLRDVTKQVGFPTTINWPTKPEGV